MAYQGARCFPQGITNADNILGQRFGTETASGFESFPWRHLVAQGGRENGALQIEIAIERSEPR